MKYYEIMWNDAMDGVNDFLKIVFTVPVNYEGSPKCKLNVMAWGGLMCEFCSTKGIR